MIPAIDPFHAISLSRIAYALEADGKSIIHMEFGQPSCGAPSSAIAAAHRVIDSDPMGYWESTELKQRIVHHYLESYGVTVEPEQIILTCGASPAFVLALNCLFTPGDKVALARPGYVAYRNTLRALYLEPVEISCGPVERYQVTAAQVAALDPAPKGLILASPANPTGTIIEPGEFARIAQVCKERNIRIISDEIYHGLCYEKQARCAREFDPHAVIVNSFSKYFAMAGWRLGWLLVPKELVGAAYARMGNLFLTPPSMSQHAALAAFDSRDELDAHVEVYRANRDLLLRRLPEMGISKIAPPDGAFYIYADVGHLTDNSLQFCLKLLEDTGVATAPGVDFDPVEGHRFMRFSFALSTKEIEEALDRMELWFAGQHR